MEWNNNLQLESIYTNLSDFLLNLNLLNIFRRCIGQFFFRARHGWLANQLSQQFVGELLMAMWDRYVFVLLIVARNRILEAFRTKALLQLCRRCQINFIAADTFLGRISFKGEKKNERRLKEGIFSVLYAKWKHGRWLPMSTKKSSKSYQTKFKIQSISRNAIQCFFFYGLLWHKKWNSILFIIFLLVGEHSIETENRFWWLRLVFKDFIAKINKFQQAYPRVSSCALEDCKPTQTSSGRYRSRAAYHLQRKIGKRKN